MMRRALLALPILLAVTPAWGQTLSITYGPSTSCGGDGGWWPARADGNCWTEDAGKIGMVPTGWAPLTAFPGTSTSGTVSVLPAAQASLTLTLPEEPLKPGDCLKIGPSGTMSKITCPEESKPLTSHDIIGDFDGTSITVGPINCAETNPCPEFLTPSPLTWQLPTQSCPDGYEAVIRETDLARWTCARDFKEPKP
jgi:hypothetical protein